MIVAAGEGKVLQRSDSPQYIPLSPCPRHVKPTHFKSSRPRQQPRSVQFQPSAMSIPTNHSPRRVDDTLTCDLDAMF